MLYYWDIKQLLRVCSHLHYSTLTILFVMNTQTSLLHMSLCMFKGLLVISTTNKLHGLKATVIKILLSLHSLSLFYSLPLSLVQPPPPSLSLPFSLPPLVFFLSLINQTQYRTFIIPIVLSECLIRIKTRKLTCFYATMKP